MALAIAVLRLVALAIEVVIRVLETLDDTP
jgi:hypothetical protein